MPGPSVREPARTGEPLLRFIGTLGLAAAIVNITIGGGIFRLPSSVAGARSVSATGSSEPSQAPVSGRCRSTTPWEVAPATGTA